MNKVIMFLLGSCSTFSIHMGLVKVSWFDMLCTHVVSLIGGVLSAVVVAWLQQRWKDRRNAR